MYGFKKAVTVNYELLDQSVKELDDFKEAIEKIITALNALQEKLENENSGKWQELFLSTYTKITTDFEECMKEIERVSGILSRYRRDMEEIMAASSRSSALKVDRDMVWNKLARESFGSILVSCKAIKEQSEGSEMILGYAEQERVTSEENYAEAMKNYRIMQQVDSIVLNCYNSIMEDYQNIVDIFNNKICAFEDRDDDYEGEATVIYNDITSTANKITDFITSFFEDTIKLAEGIIIGLARLLWGIVESIASVISLAAIGCGAIVYAGYNAADEEPPEWTAGCYNALFGEDGIGDQLYTLIHHPSLLVTGTIDQITTDFNDKGALFCVGAVGGEWVLGPKALPKIAGATKFAAGKAGTVLKNSKTGRILASAGEKIKGTKAWQRFSDLKCRIFKGDPVDIITGSLSEHNIELFIKDLDGNFIIGRNYESIVIEKGIMGYGWKSTLEISVEENEDFVSVLCSDCHYEVFVPYENHYINIKGGNENKTLEKTENGWAFKSKEERITYFFNKEGRFESAENEKGNTLKLIYNEKSEITEIITFSGKKFKVEFEDSKLSRITDEIGRNVTYRYQNDCLTEIVYPDGAFSSYEYDSKNRIISITDQNRNTHTKNIYDDKNRVIRQDYAGGSYMTCAYDDVKRENRIYFSTHDNEEIYRYNKEGLTEEIIYWDGSSEEFKYDDAYNKIYEKSRNGAVTETEYDEYGNIIVQKAPNGLETFFEYNKNNHITKITDNAGTEIINEYDEKSNLVIQKIKIEEGKYKEDKFEYDSDNRIISSTDSLGNTTHYKYPEAAEKIITSPSEVITPSGYSYKYIYDDAERNLSIETEYGTTEFVYNSLNYPAAVKDREGSITYRKYDSMGNLIEEISPSLAEEGGSRSYKFVYDEWDEIIAAENPLGAVKRVIKDGQGNILKEISPKSLPLTLENSRDIDLLELPGTEHIYNKDGNVIKNIFADGSTERFFYDSEGNIIKHIEPENYYKDMDEGFGYSYVYDNMNRIVEILNENDETEHTFEYDLFGNIIKDTDACGNIKLFKYNLSGQLIEERTPVEIIENIENSENKSEEILYNVKCFEYDCSGNKVLERHGIDKVKENEECAKFNDIFFDYDAENRLAAVRDKTGARTEYKYDSLNNKIYESFRINDTVSKKVFYKYNGLGQVVEKTEELAEDLELLSEGRKTVLSTINYEYDRDGRIVKVTEPEGRITSRKYDAAGRCVEQIQKTSSSVRKAEYIYDTADNITEVRTTAGENKKAKVNKYVYDEKDRIIKLIDVNGGVTRVFYDKNNRVVKTILPEEYKTAGENGRGTSYRYNVQNQITEIVDALGTVQTKNVYDRHGNIKSSADALGNTVEYNYSRTGLLKEIITPESRLQGKAAQSYKYDSRGNITGITDGNGNSTEYVLDEWGKIIEIHTADGGIEKYTYDYAGNITSTTDANGGRIEYRYNELNMPVEIKDQAGNSEFFAYDRRGNQILHKNRNNIIRENVFDEDGKLLKVYAFKEGTEKLLKKRFSYDEEGRIKVAEAPSVKYNYEYTDDGRLKKKTSNGKTLLEYNYDLNGRIKSLKDVSGRSTVYNYDVLGRISEITDENKNKLAAYSYLKNNSLSSVVFGNGIRTDYSYDKNGNVINLFTKTADETVLADYSYSYDLNGNRLSKTGKRYNDRYQYDSMNRLISADYGNSREEFKYDKAGNRLERRTKNSSELYQYNIKNQLLRIDVSNTGMPVKSCMDLFDELGGSRKQESFPKIFEYDPQGNVISETNPDGINRFYYDELNRQIKAEMHDGSVQRNIYDPENLRSYIAENDKITEFVFDHNSEIIAEIDEKGLVSRFSRGYDIVSAEIRTEAEFKENINNNGNYNKFEKYYYQTDENGSTDFITDVSGKIKNAYKYDAFGNIIESNEEVHNRIKYTGQQWDNTISQYYLRARYYNPAIARFTQEDVYRGDGLNLYAYCKNNPITYYDPTGYCTKKENAFNNNENLVTYRRVQGGTPPNASYYRIYPDGKGGIKIPNKTANLNVSSGDEAHAMYFLEKRGKEAEIIQFDIPKWLDDFIKENAIPQKNYKKNPLNQGKTAPKIVDPTTPGDSFELPPIWSEWLEEYGINCKIIKLE